jgi:hypothetical protein
LQCARALACSLLRVVVIAHDAMSAAANVDKAVAAIKALAEHKGSSRQALVKYFKIELKIDNPAAVAKALKGASVDYFPKHTQ